MTNLHCRACDRSYVPFVTLNGTRVCGNCGEKMPKPEPDVAALERRIAELETARTLDTIAAKMKTDRTAAWMGLPAIEERLKALESKTEVLETKASYYHHIPVGGAESWSDIIDRIAHLERQAKGRRR